ncbi:MAG TPA: dihydrofolate reductase family protein [Thermomicrobiales bacterium]|nr:dihydrofolate reductase family protein [Thermomicrobiales bacterium]
MSKVVLSEFISLDGVIEEPHNWHFPFTDAGTGKYKFDELFAAGSLLLGRVTYEGFAAAWPSMKDEQGFADRMNSLPKYVVSSTLDSADWNNSTVIRENVVEEIARLKEEPGLDILIFGSGELVNSLVPHGLIDEFRLMVHPIVVGGGKRLFSEGLDATPLKLVDTQTFSKGVVVLTYAPAEAAPE